MTNFDEYDIKILSALQDNCKITNVQLADKIGLSPSPCLTRVKLLEKAGIINRYVALLEPEKVGATVSVFIQVTLEKQSKSVLDEFETTMRAIPNVMECYLMTGDSDYLLRVVVRDTVALKDFIIQQLTNAPGVSTIRSGFALKQVKYQTALPLV